ARYAIFIALITFISNGTSHHLPEFIQPLWSAGYQLASDSRGRPA
ncbi:hypothetical protein G7B21_29135, partial [Klebsiella pneumoniae]|nr:hypothetical protein [Klebsiella pneumoniae]